MKALRHKNEKGFTMVEVLVVMLIIAIVSAIAIPIYINSQKSSRQLAVKSDLDNTIVTVAQLKQYGAYPTTLPATVKSSAGVVLTMKTSADGKKTCIQGYHTSTPTKIYRITPETKKVVNGACP